MSDPASSNLWAKRFEVLVLRPVDMFLIVAAIVAFFHRDWKFGLFLFIIGFLVGAVGQGLPHHRQHSVAKLTKAESVTFEVCRNAPEGQPPEHWNPDEGYKVVAASTKTGLILSVVVAVALLHFHFNLVCDCGCVGRCTDRICAVNAGDSYGSHNLEQSKELEGVESRKQTIVVLEPHEA